MNDKFVIACGKSIVSKYGTNSNGQAFFSTGEDPLTFDYWGDCARMCIKVNELLPNPVYRVCRIA